MNSYFLVTARISSVWFAANERVLATSIGGFMNIFGVAFGFLLTTQIVNESHSEVIVHAELKTLFQVNLSLSVIILILACTIYQEMPPSLTSLSSPIDSVESYVQFVSSIKKLACDLNFNYMTQSYAIYFALFNIS